MSPDERREKDALRKREKRAAERAAREAAIAAVSASSSPDSSAGPPPTMRDAVTTALAAMKWLADSDKAVIAQAHGLAEQIDVLTHAGDVARALSAHRALTKVLNDLGGTPTVRLQRELRSLKLKREEARPDGSGAEVPAGEALGTNVTKFERPPKRKKA